MATPERGSLMARMAAASEQVAQARSRSGAPSNFLDTQPMGHDWQVDARPGQAVVLMPGQMHFGARAASISTLLGSCVAVTLWHPQKRIGGMCHYLLPERTRKNGEAIDGRYGDEAVGAMVQALRLAGADPRDVHAHLYGGADTMPAGANLKFNVGERNIEQGWTLIDRHGFQLIGVDVGEDIPRTVVLNLGSGDVHMRRGVAVPATPSPASAHQQHGRH
jgi:chemotaxis protein CheD